MRRASVSWSTEGIQEITDQMEGWRKRTRNATAAFNEMADVILEEQQQWWNSDGEGTWAPRKEPYRSWMIRRFPSRPTLHGPDRRGRRGLQLRNQLTRRPFGFENINAQGLTVGTTLPYAVHHQQGTANMPARPPLKPRDGATEAQLTRILAGHIFADRMSRRTSNPLAKRSRGRRRR